MAPTIIVGDDESAGDVAAALLKLADNQRHVRTRTDLSKPAFDVPDDLYDRYNRQAGRKGDDEEKRANAVDKMVADNDAGDPQRITSDDELPDSAVNVEPGEGEGLGDPIEGDELPAAAVNADPHAPPAEQDAKTAPRKTAPRKRAPRKAAAKPTPADAGGGE